MQTARLKHVSVLISAAVALTVAGCGGSSSTTTVATAAQGPACDTQGSSAVAGTATYKMVLVIGPVEQMYAPSDVSANHPSTGEVMLGGAMADASGPNARHLEVHICQAVGGAVVTGANPTIDLADATTGQPAQSVAVAEMQGVASGINDLHYGNNVTIVPGHKYSAAVSLNGENATLTFTAS